VLNRLTKSAKYLLPGVAVFYLLMPGLALAKGETYEWQDATRQAIIGRGGQYTQDTVFRLSDPNKVLFSAGVQSFGCTPAGQSTISFDPKLEISITPSDYQANAAQTSGKLSFEAPPNTCSLDFDPVVIIVDPGAPGAAGSSGETCQAGDLTWIVCGIFKYLTSSIEWIEDKVIAPFLRIEPLTTDLSNNPQYAIWKQVRNIANIGFALVFLIIIFANTLSIKLDYYTIKKMIPRLVAATILVQFSYLLVGLAIDVTNVMGAGLHDLMLAGIKGQPEVQITTLVGGAGLAAGLAIAFAAAGSILTGGIFIVAITAFFAMLAIFLTLVFRQVLVTFLLIISPLAFVAWVLPNTDNFFRIWSRTLIRTLMMYPMIVALFAAGRIFSAAAAAAGSGGAASNDMRSLLGVVANIAPLILIPATFKAAGGAIVAGAASIQRLAGGSRGMFEKGGSYDRLNKWAENRRINLAAGQGVNMFGAQVGKNRFPGAQFGRGLYSGYGRTANVKARAEFVKNRAQWSKRLDEEGMTYEGYEVLSKGEDWYKDRKKSLQTKVSTTTNAEERQSLIMASDQLDLGYAEAKRYLRVNAARAAATKKRSDMGVIDDTDRESLRNYTKTMPADLGNLVASQVWYDAKEGARKGSVHMAYTKLDGTRDDVELKKYVKKQNQGTWAGYSADAYETFKKNGLLDEMAHDPSGLRILRGLVGHGGQQTGAEQQKHIREVLTKLGIPH
jgi:hypothetical protein